MTVTGSTHGLVLELFLDQTYYMYNKLSKMAGARVDVHDPMWVTNKRLYIHILTIFSSIPRPDEFGTSLSPNTATSLSVQVIFIYTFEFNSLTRWTRSREWKLLSRANVWIVGIWLDTTYQMLTPFRLFVYKQATNIPIYFLSSARHFVTARPLLQIAAAIGQNSSFRKR